MAKAKFLERSRAPIANAQLQAALVAATERLLKGRENVFGDKESYAALRTRGRAIRENVLDHLDEYLEQFADKVEAAGGVIHWATTREDAARVVLDIAKRRGVKLAVKSKSMVSEEIGLNHAMLAEGIDIVETDLGEWIIQLAQEPPSHLIVPAIHHTKESVATLFDKRTGRTVPREIAGLTRVARETLREQFLAAGMGISGVNFGIAETGTISLVTNEGNGRMVSSLPPVHIAIMGAERVVPTWDDWAVLLKLLTGSATGQRISTYVTTITGPRRDGEADGPEELHVVVLDGGRTRVLGTKYRESALCIRCGACLNVCPVYRETGGHAYGWVYSGPIGAVITPLYEGLNKYGDLAYASSLCGACLDACPVKIDLPRMLLELRHDQAEGKGTKSWLDKLVFRGYRIIAGSRVLYRLAAQVGKIVQIPFVRRGRIASAPPPLAAWTQGRDFPPLASRPFHSRASELGLWRNRDDNAQ
ncbi:MAG TPA: LutB/LldF family L-lactate oxidation iron-sulfur protein [Anaerolineae bacterium]